MLSPRSLLFLAVALPVLAGCSNPDPSAPTTPAVPMPELEAAINNSTLDEAHRGMSNKTWLWTQGGPAQIHYSTADGRDYVWLVGQRRIFVGDWRVAQDMNARGRAITKICLRYPGSGVAGLSESWTCQPAGKLFYDMTERESGDPLRLMGRSEALFLLDRTPANLADVQARVRG
jgi:hypothetical protein